MKTEVEKMYENCNIKPKQEGYCDWGSDCPYPDIINNGCENECSYWKYEDEAQYPPFTAKKQISLIIFLSYEYEKGLLINLRTIDKDINIYDFELFGECLAKLVNELWQSLTEEERKQIRGILE